MASLALIGPTKTGASNSQPDVMAEVDCAPYWRKSPRSQIYGSFLLPAVNRTKGPICCCWNGLYWAARGMIWTVHLGRRDLRSSSTSLWDRRQVPEILFPIKWGSMKWGSQTNDAIGLQQLSHSLLTTPSSSPWWSCHLFFHIGRNEV